MGVFIFSPKRPEEMEMRFNICRMTDLDLFIIIAEKRLERSTKHEAPDPDPQHPMKQEINRFIMFHVPHHGRTSRCYKTNNMAQSVFNEQVLRHGLEDR
jgi:hypothetical protein